MLREATHRIYKELLIDFKKNPLFASSIKKLTLDSEQFLPRYSFEQINALQSTLAYNFHDQKSLSTLIKY